MRRILIAIFSAGWLLPMWVAGSTLLAFLEVEAWPAWRGEQPANSFPHLRFASHAFAVGSAWLAAVLAWWAWRWSDPPRDPSGTPEAGQPGGRYDTASAAGSPHRGRTAISERRVDP
jgi:hypothetical protein